MHRVMRVGMSFLFMFSSSVFALPNSSIVLGALETDFLTTDVQLQEDFVIEESVSSKPSAWSKYFFGNMGTYLSKGQTSSRYAVSGVLGVDRTINKMRLYLSGTFVAMKQGVKQKRRENRKGVAVAAEASRDLEGYTITIEGDERTIEFQGKSVDLDEAYGQFPLGEKGLLRLGRQRIVMGQFLLFSPINFFILPAKVSGTGISREKIHFRYPQDGVSMFFFPSDKIEIQGYVFRLRYDELVQQAFHSNLFVSGLVKKDDGSYEYGAKPYELKTSGVYGKGMRVLFYQNNLTFGAIAFKGVDGFTTNLNSTLSKTKVTGATASTAYLQKLEASMAFNTGVGVEVKYQRGKWTLIGEYARIYRDSSFYPHEYKILDAGDLELAAKIKLYEWVAEKNENKMSIKSKLDIIAIGVEYFGERLRLSAGVGWLLLQRGRTQKDKEGYELAKDADFITDYEKDNTQIVPGIVALYTLNDAETLKIGGFGGVVGSGLGVGVSLQFLYQERFHVAFSWMRARQASEFFLEEILHNQGRQFKRTSTMDNTIALVAVLRY